MTVDETLKERVKVHGEFEQHALCTQKLKNVIQDCLRDFSKPHGHLRYAQQEALDMICNKIGRIIAGDPMHPDHWHDIAGYAILAEKDTKRAIV